MMKAALTVAVLALGLAACKPSTTDNNAADTNAENAALTDVNAASNDATANADTGKGPSHGAALFLCAREMLVHPSANLHRPDDCVSAGMP